MEAPRQVINVSKTSLETLDVKSEASKMLSLMNVVVKEREIKQELKKKREGKLQHKKD